MPRDPDAYLWDVLGSVEQIDRFRVGMSFRDYLADDRTSAAVKHHLVIVGKR
ncbi:nucleotidyltransferase [Pseudonocardiaceae bacterium YIM PH 21723]|nr:nucleotidyltransferase [Pseudonocardiaceae bacterium YIM PH 21723]